jgi:tetratricopeptide (TPR) repeat protein
MNRWVALLCLALLAGCRTGTLPDPNQPGDSQVSPEVLRKNLQAVSDALVDRRLKGEIDNNQYRELLAKAAAELVKQYDLKEVDPSEAWQYGEVLRAARNWSAAKEMLQIAVRHAKLVKNEDRRVNDTLRLAESMAHLGQVQESIVTAREVLDAKPTDSAPILMAVFYELAPVAKGRSHDAELAELLEAAIRKHLATRVNLESQPGRDFMAARSYHVRGAYALLTELYTNLGETAKARKALERMRMASQNIDLLTEQVLRESGDGWSKPPKEGLSRL